MYRDDERVNILRFGDQVMLEKLVIGILGTTLLSGVSVASPPLMLSSPISVHTQQERSGVDAYTTRLQIDGFDFDLSEAGQPVIINNFPLDAVRNVTLQLVTMNVLTDEARLVGTSYDRFGERVEREIPWTKVSMFRGTVVGESDSEVFLSFGGGLANGWIKVDGTRFFIGTNLTEDLTLIFDEKNVPDSMNDFYSYTCSTKTDRAPALPEGGAYRAVDSQCNQLWMAYDTDNEFLEKFGAFPEGALAAANAYVQTLVGAISSTLYEPLLDVELLVHYLRFWIDDSGNVALDPWNAVNTDGQLAEFSLYWDMNETEVERGLAQLIAGRQLGGGIASLASICTNYGYAVMGGIYNPGHPWNPPLVQSGNNWDPIVFAHETGHNFGMIHTFDFSEPIDECGEECDGWDPEAEDFDPANYRSTIMSYCHLCPGWDDEAFANGDWENILVSGDWNIRIEFAYENIIRAENVLANLPCVLWTDSAGPPTVVDDTATTEAGEYVEIEVLENDIANDCSDLSILRFSERSIRRGTIYQGSPTSLIYTPASGVIGTDSFTYTVLSENNEQPVTGNVVITITRDDDGGGGGGGGGPGTGPVDIDDVVFIITVWGTARSDWNGDGTTDIDDLLAALAGKFKPDRTSGK